MRLGVSLFPTDKGIQPIEVAKEAEARGFDSLWFPEHAHPHVAPDPLGWRAHQPAAARGVLAHP